MSRDYDSMKYADVVTSEVATATQTCDTCKHCGFDMGCDRAMDLDAYDNRGFDTNDFGSTVDCPCWEEKSQHETEPPTKTDTKAIEHEEMMKGYNPSNGNWVEYIPPTHKVGYLNADHVNKRKSHGITEDLGTDIRAVAKSTKDDIMSIDFQMVTVNKQISRYLTVIGYEMVNGKRQDTDIMIDATITIHGDNIQEFEAEFRNFLSKYRA